MIEGHPDNVSASLLGGIRASFSKDLNDFWKTTTIVESKLVTSLPVPVSPKLKVIAIIPDFELSTALARSVLPDKYSRGDIVYNLQRLSVLSLALKGDHDGNLDPSIISECIKDKIHQPYVLIIKL